MIFKTKQNPSETWKPFHSKLGFFDFFLCKAPNAATTTIVYYFSVNSSNELLFTIVCIRRRIELIIIIILAGMAVFFNVTGYLIEEGRRWPIPTRTKF